MDCVNNLALKMLRECWGFKKEETRDIMFQYLYADTMLEIQIRDLNNLLLGIYFCDNNHYFLPGYWPLEAEGTFCRCCKPTK